MTQAALVAVQLEIGHDAVASPDAYRRHLEAAATRAFAACPEASARFAVFPETAGHLALYALAPATARKARTVAAALAASAARRPLDILRGVVSTRLLDPKHAVIAALAPDGERFWKSVFGPLAREHRAYIVAGSYLRLAPDGELHNSSVLFGPDGRLLGTTDKVNLLPGIEDGARHGLALARGSERIPTVDTPVGKVATLIAYDAFVSPHTRNERFAPLGAALAERGPVTIVANPASNPWSWAENAVQWEDKGLRATLATHRVARFGITAHLVGRVLDFTFEGRSEVLGVNDRVDVLARATSHDRGEVVVANVDL